MHTHKKHLRQPKPQPLVEIVDSGNNPLGVMSLQEVRRQRLFYRVVVVMIYNKKNKLCLQKRNDNRVVYPGRWDISVETHLHAGEGSLDTACKKIQEQLGIYNTVPRFFHTMPPAVETGYGFIDIYTLNKLETQMPCKEPKRELFVDKDELSGLIEHCPELVTPHLVYFWDQGILFR